MKKSTKIISAILAVVLIGGSAAMMSRFIKIPTSEPSEEIQPTNHEYSITYKMVVDGGEAVEVYEPLFNDEGNYPTGYNSDTGTKIDDLDARVDVTKNTDYNFEGWFMNEELTIEFNGTIYPGATGDITFYAKISQGFWTDFY